MIWTKHALDRIAERGFTKEDVERYVKSNQPDDARDMGNLVFSIPRGQGRIVKVVTDATRSSVVSVYWKDRRP